MTQIAVQLAASAAVPPPPQWRQPNYGPAKGDALSGLWPWPHKATSTGANPLTLRPAFTFQTHGSFKTKVCRFKTTACRFKTTVCHSETNCKTTICRPNTTVCRGKTTVCRFTVCDFKTTVCR